MPADWKVKYTTPSPPLVIGLANGKVEYGNGYFVDRTDKLTQTHITLARIKESEFDEIVMQTFSKTKACEIKAAQAAFPADAL